MLAGGGGLSSRAGSASPVTLRSLQLVQDKGKVEKYLQQSLPYLQHTQVALREAAIRFIGEPQPPGSLFCQPLAAPVSLESPPGLGPHASGPGGSLAGF